MATEKDIPRPKKMESIDWKNLHEGILIMKKKSELTICRGMDLLIK